VGVGLAGDAPHNAVVAVGLLMPDRFDVLGLVAERLDAGHLDGLCRLDSDPVVMATLGGPRSRETTTEHLRYDLQRWDVHGLGMYALLSGAAELVGRAGLRSRVLLDRPEVEVAYSLRPEWWGQGLATVVVRRLADLAEAGRVAGSLVATVGRTNPASVRVVEKAGFELEAEIERAHETMALYRRPLRRAGVL
jgi:RimJ/RimL family protein N-acetyltransferase